MSAPTLRDAWLAVREADREVVILSPDGFEVADSFRALHAAFADPNREVVVLDGRGWLEYGDLMDPERRDTDRRPSLQTDAGRRRTS